MKPKTVRAINVFLNLDDDEKEEFLKLINKFDIRYPNTSSREIRESWEFAHESKRLNLSLGPSPSGNCPYCGK